MPLYSVRVRMLQEYGRPRGSPFAEMVHHFHFDSDENAVACLDHMVTHFNGRDALIFSPAISNRWTAARDAMAHTLTLYRRSLGDERSWVRLGEVQFDLAPYKGYSGTNELGGVAITGELREEPVLRHKRAAVLVRENTVDPLVHRRVYIGPLSRVAVTGDVTHIEGVPIPPEFRARIWFPHPVLLDAPWDPNTDTADLWDQYLVGFAVDHVRNLQFPDFGGYTVVPSWRYGTVEAVTYVQGSNVRAELRSRGSEGVMTNPLPAEAP